MNESLRILVIEDNPADADFIQALLPKLGPLRFQIEVVARLAEAITRLQGPGHNLDLVLLDLGLPDSQGLATFQKLHQAVPEVAVIVLSGANDEELAVAAVQAGAQDYLVKGSVSGNLLVRAARYAVSRHTAEVAGREAARLAQATIDALTANICVLNETGEIIATNLAWQRFAAANAPGHPPTPPVGFNYLQVCDAVADLDREQAAAMTTGIRAVMAGAQAEFVLEYPCHSPTEQRWFLGRVTRFHGAGPVRVVVAHTNITERKRMEESLRKNQQLLAEAEEIGQVGGWEFDIATRQAVWTETVYHIHELDPAVQPTVELGIQFYTPESRPVIAQAVQRAIEQGQPFNVELEIITAKGHRRNVQAIGHADLGRGKVFGFFQDITERKRSEEQLNLQFRALTAAVNGIVITDRTGKIEWVNPSFTQLTGYPAEEVIGQNPRLLKSGQHPPEFYADLWRQVSTGHVWRGEMVNKHKAGRIYREDMSITPVRGADGQIAHYVAIKQDVTEQRQMESQLQQMQKMEAIGTLAGGIAHDFNNILSAMFGYGYLLQQDLAGNPVALDSVAQILQAAHRAKDLVQQILTFSRRHEQNRQAIRLDVVVKEAMKFLRASLPANIIFEQHIAPDAPVVLADATQIYQVTMNLATNALHAMEGRSGQLTVSLDSFMPDETFIQKHPGCCASHLARLTVSDTGCGMDAITLERIFEPFFTTKPIGKGTGLGLSVVHGITQSHEGLITVESQVGGGTTFRLYFPALTAATSLTETATGQLPHGGGQQILVIDDEQALTAMYQRALVGLNYKVVGCNAPREALRIFLENPGRFDLVITDLTMPEMNGLEVARQFRAARPELPVILVSGFTPELTPENLQAAGICKMLEKPVSMPALAEAIQRALKS